MGLYISVGHQQPTLVLSFSSINASLTGFLMAILSSSQASPDLMCK